MFFCNYIDKDLEESIMSMMSDLRKFEELQNHAGINLGMIFILNKDSMTISSVKRWIEGFN